MSSTQFGVGTRVRMKCEGCGDVLYDEIHYLYTRVPS
jgi:hypothetical protein